MSTTISTSHTGLTALQDTDRLGAQYIRRYLLNDGHDSDSVRRAAHSLEVLLQEQPYTSRCIFHIINRKS